MVDIYDNDEKIGSVIVDDEGKWSYTPDTPLAKGDHEITTTVTDPSGNTSEPSPGSPSPSIRIQTSDRG